ncbi:site-specific integrase [uncultured Bacteroides sp.]|uniref:site-specific integrase n=1 Tax=uncultured Bacteroides sp. TaxID=162156 RepID=UPI002594101E|nr:site-specific integrase [uncultured Bacteroides sp.]
MKDRTSITLRQRELPSGNTTLYLDIVCNGRRKTESLKLFLVPENTRSDKQKNKETMKLAEAILAKRIVEVQNKEFGFKQDYAEDTNFYDYYVAITEKRLGTESRGNWGNWRSCLKHMEKYDPKIKTRTFTDITPKWIQGFKDYLEKDAYAWGCDYRERIKDHPLSRNSKLSYFNKLKACINQALEERIISFNPLLGIEGFKAQEGTRMYLTIDEVRTLAQTECEYPNIKRAFLFSCLTGLRRSDVIRLTWSDIQKQGEYTRIIFKQKKTGGQEYLDISPQAAELLGTRGKPNEQVFTDIHSPSCTNEAIKRWVLRAGINKEITFHCARHTFAVMMLDLGTDIYTVSKLLGHRELSTTQIYAKVLDKNKQAAVSLIPDDIFGK